VRLFSDLVRVCPQKILQSGGLSSADIFQTRGGGAADVNSALFDAKNFEFLKIYGVSVRT